MSSLLQQRFGADAVDRRDVPAWGRKDVPCITPGSLEALREVVRYASSDAQVLVPIGMGSKLDWTAPPERMDALVCTRRLAGVLDHVPADGTLTAQAGTSMQELAQAVAGGGHRLTPDVPGPARSTLGGTVAAGASGVDRLRFGPTRHHVLGARVVLGDGSLARSGGQLVKNVTGFDLHRLYAGSHGTLCVIADVSLRLLPGPEHEVLLQCVVAQASVALELAREAQRLAPHLVSLSLARSEAADQAARWLLTASIFGKREAVDAELEQVRGRWPNPRVLEGAGAREEAEGLRERGFERDTRPWLRANLRPSRVARALSALERRLAESQAQPRILLQPAIAHVDVQLDPDAPVEPSAAWIGAWRQDLESLGARAHLRAAPVDLAKRATRWHGTPVGLGRMRALQESLDPTGVFARGRLAGGL